MPKAVSQRAVILLVEEHAPFLQEVSSVANNLDTSLRVIAVQSGKNLVVCFSLLAAIDVVA